MGSERGAPRRQQNHSCFGATSISPGLASGLTLFLPGSPAKNCSGEVNSQPGIIKVLSDLAASVPPPAFVTQQCITRGQADPSGNCWGLFYSSKQCRNALRHLPGVPWALLHASSRYAGTGLANRAAPRVSQRTQPPEQGYSLTASCREGRGWALAFWEH